MKIEIGYPQAINMEKLLKHRFLPEHWKHIWEDYDGGPTVAQNGCHWLLTIGKNVHLCFIDDYGNLKR